MPGAATDLRHARHRALDGVGADGIEAIRASRVAVVGLGGTGAHAAVALAAAGVGNLSLVDFDTVDATNLGRQSWYQPGDIGAEKARTLGQRIHAQNPDCHTDIHVQRADAALLDALARTHDVLVDATDNFASRFAINTAAVRRSCRLVSGSAVRWEGQLASFGPDYASSPCYACLYQPDDESLDDCQGAGVLAPVPGTIGQLMATATLSALLQLEPTRQLTLWDARRGLWRHVALTKNPDCATCGHLTEGTPE